MKTVWLQLFYIALAANASAQYNPSSSSIFLQYTLMKSPEEKNLELNNFPERQYEVVSNINSDTNQFLYIPTSAHFHMNTPFAYADSIYYWKWDGIDENWLYYRKTTIFEDEITHSFQFCYFSWDGLQWNKLNRSTAYYNDSDRLYQSISQKWNGVSWINDSQYFYEYDIDLNPSKYTYQIWNNNQWVNLILTLSTYDQYKHELHWLSKLWQAGDWVNQRQVFNSYNADHLLSQVNTQDWSDFWKDTWLQVYMYDTLGSLNDTIGLNLLNLNYVDSIGWVTDSRAIYRYDLVRKLLFGETQSLQNGQWLGKSRDFYDYDQDGERIKYLNQTFDQTLWKNVKQEIYKYDTQNLLSTIVIQKWNNEWMNTDSIHYYFHQSTGALEVDSKPFDVNIYPNPATTLLNITFGDKLIGDVALEIYSLSGVKELETKLNSSENNIIDISRLTPGEYHVLIKSEKGLTIRSFVKM